MKSPEIYSKIIPTYRLPINKLERRYLYMLMYFYFRLIQFLVAFDISWKTIAELLSPRVPFAFIIYPRKFGHMITGWNNIIYLRKLQLYKHFKTFKYSFFSTFSSLSFSVQWGGISCNYLFTIEWGEGGRDYVVCHRLSTFPTEDSFLFPDNPILHMWTPKGSNWCNLLRRH